MYRLLLIDDDTDVLEINKKSFSEQGYEVRCAKNAQEGFAALTEYSPDCLLLDVMMPGMDGFDFCRQVREHSAVPIIFLTARVSEDDKIKGLLLGGDDYVEKPYSFKELEARVSANIRRGASSATDGKLVFPPLEIDIARHAAYCASENLNLTNREYDILFLLAKNAGQPVTFQQIGEMMWGSYRPEDRRSVMMGVSRLRKKLEIHPATARMIETVWSEGYRFLQGK